MPGSSKETLLQKAVARSQHSICLVGRNGAFEPASRVENPNLARAKTAAPSGAVDRLLSIQEHGLHTGASYTLSLGRLWYGMRKPRRAEDALKRRVT